MRGSAKGDLEAPIPALGPRLSVPLATCRALQESGIGNLSKLGLKHLKVHDRS